MIFSKAALHSTLTRMRYTGQALQEYVVWLEKWALYWHLWSLLRLELSFHSVFRELCGSLQISLWNHSLCPADERRPHMAAGHLAFATGGWVPKSFNSDERWSRTGLLLVSRIKVSTSCPAAPAVTVSGAATVERQAPPSSNASSRSFTSQKMIGAKWTKRVRRCLRLQKRMCNRPNWHFLRHTRPSFYKGPPRTWWKTYWW